MNHLCIWLARQERTQSPAGLTFMTALGEVSITWDTEEDRQDQGMSESPSFCSSGRLSEEPPTDMCNQPHVSLSHSLPLWLMSPPDSIEAIRQ